MLPICVFFFLFLCVCTYAKATYRGPNIQYVHCEESIQYALYVVEFVVSYYDLIISSHQSWCSYCTFFLEKEIISAIFFSFLNIVETETVECCC